MGQLLSRLPDLRVAMLVEHAWSDATCAWGSL